ncbi:alpha/beta hydrolase family protein [Deinococcus alpinitundrae]|uniref:alpha/beta hydrolase family protein n=1 Tax=Deinococcus alpinitundrae TaxID=468913 RepID=UPI00137A2392|nr:CocE/NonD family hydrolase [Deinococcus alpinitundrae]
MVFSSSKFRKLSGPVLLGFLLALGLVLAARSSPIPVVLVARLNYKVDGLKINGLICRPDTRLSRPLLNLVHGGLDSPIDEALCRRFARLGYVVAASALRGQGGSQGRPEICGGEVNDVRALGSLARQRFRADPRRVGYLGVSLGGCIALKAAALSSGVRAALTLLSPTDFAEQLRLLSHRPGAVARWEALLGGSAAQVPAAYAARRPLDALARLKAPLLTVAAARDQLIALRQSCEAADVRRAAGHRVVEVRLTISGSPGKLNQGCPKTAAVGQLPSLRGQDVLLIYENLDHLSTPNMWQAAEAYLAANLAPPR